MHFNISWWELLIKGIPESFLDVLGVFLLSKVKFRINQYLIATLYFILATVIIRGFVYNNPGVSTMISLLVLVIFMVLYNHIEIASAIKAVLIIVLIIMICEALNMLILYLIYGDNYGENMKNFVGLKKAIIGIPSTILLAISVIIIYFINIRKDKGKIDSGEVSTKNRK